MKSRSPLGKFLPDVVDPQKVGDMGFAVYQAKRGASKALQTVHDLLVDGAITEDEHQTAYDLSVLLKAISGQCLCASAFLTTFQP